MILRRIAQHMKQQHWTGVFIELVIVIVGVFIGLQADNWNTARKQRQAETELVGELRSNLATAIDIKSIWIKRETTFMHNLADGIAVVQGLSNASSISSKECSAMWRTSVPLPSSDDATFIALLTPTRLSIIHNQKLRSALLAYRSHHDRITIFNDRVIGSSQDVVDNYPDAFPRRLDMRAPYLSDISCNLEKMRSSHALQNKLLSNLGRIHGTVRNTKGGLEQLKHLEAEVDAYHP